MALLLSQSGPAQASDAAMSAFAENCFRPTMTAAHAETRLGLPGVRYDFYDTNPFTSAAPSPATGRPATPGTDRRCEVSFDGAQIDAATAAVTAGLDAEGIRTPADVPATFQTIPGVALVAARRLNPRKVAVVQVGTRPGPNGTETYMNVERLRSPQ
ncbi:MAG: succinyl-CoA synthetase subunit beta [Pseudomonadota bacterium]